MTPHKMNVLINLEHFSTIFSSAKSDSKVTIFVMASHSNVQDRMPLFEALIMATFSILLPSWDAFSDVYFACNLIAKGHPIFGFTILYPVFLATFFILPHWWRKETTLKSHFIDNAVNLVDKSGSYINYREVKIFTSLEELFLIRVQLICR